MKWSTAGIAFLGLLALPIAVEADAPPAAKRAVSWKKIVLDKTFRAEGVAVADVNKDGKMDILAGEVWYEAPDWKMHVIRQGKGPYNPLQYSNSFACFADDINGDSWPDLVVISFPGTPCYWYENPRNQPGPWPEHLITTSACNESPQYVDLFGSGKRVLVMGWQPDNKKDNMGQMCWFRPGQDPRQPWQRMPISEPSQPGKEIPGTKRYSHGLGFGDINGDGRRDVLCTAGWWEQPAKVSEQPWTFHPVDLGEACADMRVLDLDGDGKVDVISTSAHSYGMWWHQQRPGAFVKQDLFPQPQTWSSVPKDAPLAQEERELLGLINKYRTDIRKAPFKLNPALSRAARDQAVKATGVINLTNLEEAAKKAGYPGKPFGLVLSDPGPIKELVGELGKFFTPDGKKILEGLWGEIGLRLAKNDKGTYKLAILLGNSGQFYIPSQTHAIHLVDLNGDGLPDIVTGRRWWAHGPKGDPGSGDPAYLYWFEAKRNKEGIITFTPHLIDDDSGVGTQFEVCDVNGDGLPDIIIANKKGVFVFLQQVAKE